jgi:hypothetical protein
MSYNQAYNSGASAMGGTGGISKTTPQAAIIINSSAESYVKMQRENNQKSIYPNLLAQNFYIARGELCFAYKSTEYSTHVSTKNNPSVQVFTSANGMITPKDVKNATNKEAVKRSIAKSIWFVGVAQGDKMQRDFENRSLAIAIRAAGTDTIYNSGDSYIYPGDTVMWEMPDVDGQKNIRFGEPKTKNLFKVSKYNYNSNTIKGMLSNIPTDAAAGDSNAILLQKSLTEFVELVKGSPGQPQQIVSKMLSGGDPHLQSAMIDLIRIFDMHKQEEFDRRIIGKALSEGKPGQNFDIILHHHHKIS